MPSLLPTDSNNNPIPALRLKPNAAHAIAVGASPARNTTAFEDDTQIVSIYATVPVYISFGDNNVIATPSDHYYPTGMYYDFAIGGDGAFKCTHLSVLKADASNGFVYISEKT